MTTTQESPLSILHVQPLGASLPRRKTANLYRSAQLELVRLILHADESTPCHVAPGDLTAHCLEGRVEVCIGEATQELSAGDLVAIPEQTEHSLHAIEDSSVLLTICHTCEKPRVDEVEEASDESFPASDPPAWTGTRS